MVHNVNVSTKEAANWVRDTDAAREAFYQRHFPTRPLIPEVLVEGGANSGQARLIRRKQTVAELIALEAV